MVFERMALIAPRRPRFDRGPRLSTWRLASLVGLAMIFAASAQAQIVIGGRSQPSVVVDLGVLDRLGPAPTLPQYFLGENFRPSQQYRQEAYRPARVATRRRARAPVRRLALRAPGTGIARAETAEAARPVTLSKPGIIHLTPPTRLASATTGAPSAISHDEAAVSQPTQTSVAALAPPEPTPPPAQDVPAPPTLPASPSRDEPPSPPVEPQAQSQTASPPAPPVATAAAPAPSPPPVPDQTPAAAPPAPVATGQPAILAPPATIAPPPAAPPLQMASAGSAGLAPTTIMFASGETDLPSAAQPQLDAVAARLQTNDALRVQLVAHATGTPDQAIEARRISLARAVAVRAYLIDKGVRSLRMDVRALGNRADDGVAGDQVDLVIVSQ
jgi:outer membrane protein OmpA-like peptidoglycan-associated protein